MEPKVYKWMEPKVYTWVAEIKDFDELMRPKQCDCDKKIIITADGKTTKARFYEGKKLIKEALARCHSDDEFNFATGAKIAFDRLVDREEKSRYYSGKIVCVHSASPSFTKGKIYTVRDGQVITNYGNPSPDVCANLDEINNRFYSKFIELVED